MAVHTELLWIPLAVTAEGLWHLGHMPILSKGIKRGQKETPPCGGVGPTSKTLGMSYNHHM